MTPTSFSTNFTTLPGHWLGYVCPQCGKGIPCLWNVFSLFFLAISFPLWWLPVHIYGPKWRSWQWERMRGVTPAPLLDGVRKFRWIRFGILFWGVPTGLLVSLVMANFIPGRTYLESLGLLALLFPIWLVAGVGFGLTMKWLATKWGTS